MLIALLFKWCSLCCSIIICGFLQHNLLQHNLLHFLIYQGIVIRLWYSCCVTCRFRNKLCLPTQVQACNGTVHAIYVEEVLTSTCKYRSYATEHESKQCNTERALAICTGVCVCVCVCACASFVVLNLEYVRICSPMYQRFVNVMCDMTGDERKVSVCDNSLPLK